MIYPNEPRALLIDQQNQYMQINCGSDQGYPNKSKDFQNYENMNDSFIKKP